MYPAGELAVLRQLLFFFFVFFFFFFFSKKPFLIYFIFGMIIHVDIGPNFIQHYPHPCLWQGGQGHRLRNLC